MRFRRFLFLFAGLFVLLSSCTKIRDLISPPTPRELYSREFDKENPLLVAWEQAYETSLSDSLAMLLPYSETGQFQPNSIHVYSYDIELEQGETFHFEVRVDSLDSRIFIDLFKQVNDSLDTYEIIERNEPADRALQFNVRETGIYKIVIQPALDVRTPFAWIAYTQPAYLFPVAGYDNSAIMSFWGDARDAGRRQHEGIDIFAPRGTPVVAATDGRIRYTGERGLGGKQVWLRTGFLGGKSLYYAHLDSIANVDGKVERGDTLGFVGNTGNARTTNPHLHFGIYGGGGAVNPLPFVYERNRPEFPALPDEEEKKEVVVQSLVANLRTAASMQGKKIGEAGRGDRLKLLGHSGTWHHIKTGEEKKAFIHESLVE